MEYNKLCELYNSLESTTKRLEKTFHLSNFLKKTPTSLIDSTILLLEGRVFPTWDERELGVAARLAVKAISVAYGIDAAKVENEWSKIGDLGMVAEKMSGNKTQTTLFSEGLTVEHVFDSLQKLASLQGKGTVDRKLGIISQLLTSAQPIEARYITRTILQELRVGVGSGSVRDAIAWATFPPVVGVFAKHEGEWKPAALLPKKAKTDDISSLNILTVETAVEILDADLSKFDAIAPADPKDDKAGREMYQLLTDSVQGAYDITNDFGEVAKAAKKSGLRGLMSMEISVGKPLKVMLAQKVNDVKEGLKKLDIPLAAEYKYDGFRMQVHKQDSGNGDEEILIFTRRLENVTTQFPEVKEYVSEHIKAKSFIIDCEAVGMDPKTKTYLPFQKISQRIRRKYDIDDMAKQLPVELNVFDILYLDGSSTIDQTFEKRREMLEKILNPEVGKIVLSKKLVTNDAEAIDKFYKESLGAGNEGLMLKKLDAPYKPGSRVGFMVKLKPTMDTLDVVIVGAEWGEGKRASWFTSFTVAVIDENDELLEIGKVGTGIKELEGEGVTFLQLTDLLKPLVLTQKGREVSLKPKIVLELKFEEIQKSPTYSSGYALRFPRVVNLREDRSPEEASSLFQVETSYRDQKH